MNYLDRFKKKISIIDPFPLIIFEDFLNDHENNEIFKIIKENNSFDTEKFGGRKQVRLGSSNYQNLINESVYLRNVSNFLNNKETFKFLLQEINNLSKNNKYIFKSDKNISYEEKPNYSFFNQNLKLKDKIFNKIKKILNFDKNKISLQIDFSLSSKGYEREPHTDKSTRILVMLIYFNNLKKEDGGSLEIYKYKSEKKKYNSNPSLNEIEKKHCFIPKAKSLIVFQSNPESVHSVSKMISNNERVFAYGAYTMKYPINWQNNESKNISILKKL